MLSIMFFLSIQIVFADTTADSKPASPSVSSQAVALIATLAKPAPSSTPFVEIRNSPLLKQPLRISGKYIRSDLSTLIRQVDAPYQETTTLSQDSIRIEREGKKIRNLSATRIPQLAALQLSLGALLSGDHSKLSEHFSLALDQQQNFWTLTLSPKQPKKIKTRQIVLIGIADELRCVDTLPLKGAQQVTLLASAATKIANDEIVLTDNNALLAACRSQ